MSPIVTVAPIREARRQYRVVLPVAPMSAGRFSVISVPLDVAVMLATIGPGEAANNGGVRNDR
jgi:hypothetical protein